MQLLCQVFILFVFFGLPLFASFLGACEDNEPGQFVLSCVIALIVFAVFCGAGAFSKILGG